MAGALRKTMVYLGLAEEDERYDAYDDYDDYDKEPAPRRARRTPARSAPRAVTPLPQRTPGRPRGPRRRGGGAEPHHDRSTRAPTTRPRTSVRRSARAPR